MFCPLCVSELLDRTFRSGIEIDICPNCRGVWLDRGELDRLVEDYDKEIENQLEPEGFVTPTASGPPPPRTPPPPRHSDRSTPPPPPTGWHEPEKPERPRKKKKRKKKKGFDDRVEDLFDELFDFFD